MPRVARTSSAETSILDSCSHLGKDSQPKNLFDYPQGLSIGFDFKISEFVRGQALVVKFAETGFIAKERTVSDAGSAFQEICDGTVQPDQRDVGPTQKRDILLLRRGSTAQRNDAGLLLFGGLAENARELFVLDSPEFRLAELGENIGDGLASMFDDALVEIHVLPANLTREQPRDGGFAAAHEPG
jgi:hypothetical protein